LEDISRVAQEDIKKTVQDFENYEVAPEPELPIDHAGPVDLEEINFAGIEASKQLKRQAVAALKKIVHDKGLQAVKNMKDILRDHSFEFDKSWCYQCNQECYIGNGRPQPTSGPPAEEIEEMITMAVAGIS
jgi:hypothetical protein